MSQLDGSDIVYTARVPVAKIIGLSVHIGTRFPAVATSMGQVLLADLSTKELDAALKAPSLSRVVPRVRPSRKEIDAALAEVRTRGWAMSDERLSFGIRSVAAPVRDAQGKVIVPEHKGLKDVVGTTIPFEYKPFQGGTQGADFKAMYDQVKGGAFLEAVQRMKGSGAISEIEGTKATAALTEASTAQSPDAFRAAMSKFRDAIQTGMTNASTKAGKARIPTYNPATGRVE
jgi:hypothetical protein